MTKDTNRPSALGAPPRHPHRSPGLGASDPRLERRWHAHILGEDGQSVSEYLTVVGVTAATVIACTAMFVAPVARAYIGLFKRLVLQFTSVP